ncbi:MULTISPECIES: hypothetical protein [unclassified Bradyrhizobium]
MTTMRKSRITRGERNAAWIETFCRTPSGPMRGEKVQLSQAQREIVRKLYDGGDEVEPVTGHLASYVTLLHVCGPEAVAQRSTFPLVEADAFSVWAATSEKLREVLRRDGERVVCPELGTSFPRAA